MGTRRVLTSFAMKMSASMKGVLAASIALVAIVLVISVQYGDDAVEEARESMFDRDEAHVSSHAMKKAAKKAPKKAAHGKKHHKYVKGENTLRSRIHKALKVAQKSLRHAHGKKQKMAAKAAVKAALADAGVADADNAGTIAWANRNLDAAKKWADHALKRDAKSLGKVAAWKVGDRCRLCHQEQGDGCQGGQASCGWQAQVVRWSHHQGPHCCQACPPSRPECHARCQHNSPHGDGKEERYHQQPPPVRWRTPRR